MLKLVVRNCGSRVHLDVGGRQSELVRAPLASGAVEDAVGVDGPAVTQGHAREPSVAADLADEGIEHDLHAEAPRHLHAQGVGEVGIELHQQAFAGVHERDLHAEGGEDAGILAADHAAADHDEAARDGGEREHVVAVDHDGAVERDLRRVHGTRPGGDQEDIGGDAPWFLLVARHLDRVRRGEAGLALDRDDAVLLQVARDDLPGVVDDGPLAVHEVADRDVGLDAVLDAVEAALAEAAQVERCLAEGLGRDGPRVDRGTTGLRRAFDQADPLAEVGRLGGTLFAGRPAADDAEVEVV
jgi:hypothetical protein